MNSRLAYRHFILAIIMRSFTHAVTFSVLCSLFLSVAFGGSVLGLLLFPVLCTVYISSYAVHELGHYFVAARLGAQPVLWIDYQSVSVLSNPESARQGQLIALSGPLLAVAWIAVWWGVVSLLSSALCFAALIPAGLLASAHLGSLLPVFSDGKALSQYYAIKRRYV